MEFISLYGSYIKVYFKSRMEYRFSFFSGILANFYCYFITYVTFWVLIKNFNTIGGWDFNDMTILYGLNLLTYSISGVLFWYTVFHLNKEIITGSFDIYLVRPIGVIKQMICKRFGDTFLGQIIVTLIFMVAALSNINYKLTLYSYIYLVFAIIGGILIQSGAMIILGSLNFWFLKSDELAEILYYEVREFVNYPLSIFPTYIQIILTFVLPWAIINYYPSLIILKKVQSLQELIIGMSSPLIGLFIFLISLYIFEQGLKKYSGTGS